MLKDKIMKELKLKFGIDSEITVFSDDNKHFNTVIVSDLFKDKSLLDRQKLVYDVIGKYITNKEVHAFSFKTYAKDEWNKLE